MEKREKEPVNSMVTSVEDMKILGKQMEHQRTNEELKRDERQPDPVQSDEPAAGRKPKK